MSSYPSVEPDRVLVRRATSALVHLIVGHSGAHGVLRGQVLGEDDVVEGESLGQGEAARLEQVWGMRARELVELGACALCPGMGHGVEQTRSYASPAGATPI